MDMFGVIMAARQEKRVRAMIYQTKESAAAEPGAIEVYEVLLDGRCIGWATTQDGAAEFASRERISGQWVVIRQHKLA